jgi:hypothetical protein
MFAAVDRLYELENLRRSIAMLEPRANALDRESAMGLIEELQGTTRQLNWLRLGLAELMAGRPPTVG